MKRRVFLGQLSVVAAAGFGLPACRRQVTRGEVLEALARDVLATDIVAIVGVSRNLEKAVASLAGAPSPEALAAAREAWRDAAIRWKRGYCYRNGPLVETAALLRAAFWPARPDGIDLLLKRPLPEGDYVRTLGVDVKGLYALEYLLFGKGGEPVGPGRFTGPEAESVREFARAIAMDVRHWAEKANSALGDGKRLAMRLATGGQESLDYLVNQMAGTAESVHERLAQVQELARGDRLKPRDVEGWPSGTSTEILATLIAGTERIYLGEGAGLEALVVGAAPGLAPRFRAAFGGVREALRALSGPLEEAARTKQKELGEAAAKARILELALKVELPSALGVTLTFSSTDGD